MAAGMVESTIEMNLVCCNAAVSACDKGRSQDEVNHPCEGGWFQRICVELRSVA